MNRNQLQQTLRDVLRLQLLKKQQPRTKKVLAALDSMSNDEEFIDILLARVRLAENWPAEAV